MSLPEEPLGGVKTVPELADGPDGQQALLFRPQLLNDGHDDWRVTSLIDEIRILRRLTENASKHPGKARVIRMLGCRESAPPTLTLEFVKPFGFDLMAFVIKLNKEGSAVGAPLFTHFVKQFVDVLDYMKLVEVVHGDIKCNNVLVTRQGDIKLIDFGYACTKGASRMWPAEGENVAPEVMNLEAVADYPVDMWGLSSIFKDFNDFAGPLPEALQQTCGCLRIEDPYHRMTLEQLRLEIWMQQDGAQLGFVGSLSTAEQARVPLTSGFALKVTGAMLDGLEGSRTIGTAQLMQHGVQVLYVDRAFRDDRSAFERGEENIVRVPGFGTEISEGDWLYIGFPEGQPKNNYIRKMAVLAAAVKEQPPCIPTYFFFDEVAVPEFADNYALGPPLGAVAPESRAFLSKSYEKLQPPPSGYLHLRNNFGINLAGIRRDGKLIFFPGPDVVLKQGDIALLVRAVGVDGVSVATHPMELIRSFLDRDQFEQRVLGKDDVWQPLGHKKGIFRKQDSSECTIGARALGDGRDAARALYVANELDCLLALTYEEPLPADSHDGRSRIIRLLRFSAGSSGCPTFMTVELVTPFGFDLRSLIDKYNHDSRDMEVTVLAHLFAQLVQALHYMKSKGVVHGSLHCGQLLVSCSHDIKLVNFGDGARIDIWKEWPSKPHIAPEARGTRAPATYAQDIFGLGWVLNELTSSVARSALTTEGVQETLMSALSPGPVERASLEDCFAPWVSLQMAPANMIDVELVQLAGG